MPRTRRTFSNILPLAVTLGITATVTGAAITFAAPQTKQTKKPATTTKPKVPQSTQTGFTDNTPLTEDQRIVHVLNRIGFGPRPGDVEKVKAMGLNKYIDLQLHPERIDTSAVESKLADFDILKQSNTELATSYADSLKLGRELKELEAKLAKQTADGDGIKEMQDATPQEKAGKLREMLVNATPEDRAKLRQMVEERRKDGKRVMVQDASRAMQMAKVVRATESDAQLYEVMCDFWSNHFNIDIRKNQCRVLKVADEREVIRKNALGKFRDLLGASAHSPAMMVYLDNSTNVAPVEMNPRQERRRQAVLDQAAKNNPNNPLAQTVIANAKAKKGINENYAREIMELHTLGVDGGYTQKDVQEVARCFTGWGVAGARTGEPGIWTFNARAHDNGEKTVMGTTIPANGGEADGEKVLDILASSPATMRFVSTKLCKRLVSDEPPKTLVDKCVSTWKRTDGDIREIVRTIVTSPEFYSRASYRQKIKSPFEYAVSSVRAVSGTFDLSGRQVKNARLNGGNNLANVAMNRTIAGQVATMGQPLYQYQAPTGWSEDSRKWVSTGALVSRLNFALGLTRGDMLDVELQEPAIASGASAASIVDTVTKSLLNGDVSPATRATLLKQADATVASDSNAAGQPLEKRLTALVLGSPEFQRR